MSHDAVIVDAGMGNIGSVANMCRKVGATVEVTTDPARVLTANRLLLPGVGAFDAAMERLRVRGLDAALTERCIGQAVPVLGICLGMQLLFDSSAEGTSGGLGWLRGRSERLPSMTAAGSVRIPHMGWNTLALAKPSELFAKQSADARFYFVHSFAVVPDDDDCILARATHGDPFVAAVKHESIAGVQFHPEKSHRHGMALLAAFLGR